MVLAKGTIKLKTLKKKTCKKWDLKMLKSNTTSKNYENKTNDCGLDNISAELLKNAGNKTKNCLF